MVCRQVLEETGFDISELVNHEEYLECRVNEQLSRLYIVPGVPLGTQFRAKTRNEIKVNRHHCLLLMLVFLSLQ